MQNVKHLDDLSEMVEIFLLIVHSYNRLENFFLKNYHKIMSSLFNIFRHKIEKMFGFKQIWHDKES